jgi:hypothetical protein
MITDVGICRGIGDAAWLLLHRRDGEWQRDSVAYGPLSAVVADALKDLGDCDFSFSDTGLRRGFTFPRVPMEVAAFPNVTTSIMAPESSVTDVWGIVTRDFTGGWTRSPQRFRAAQLAEVIGGGRVSGGWFRDPHGGGGYMSFNKPGELPFGRSLVARRTWHLQEMVPTLYETERERA